MCGRYALFRGIDELASFFNAVTIHEYEPSWNITPGSNPYVLILNGIAPSERFQLSRHQWGIHFPWMPQGKELVNIRSESAESKPSFRPLRENRLLIPADGYFEWHADSRLPYYFTDIDGLPLAFAALASADGFAILTREAGKDISSIHPRTPVVVPKQNWHQWMDPSTNMEEFVYKLPQAKYTFWRVRQQVGNPRNNDAANIACVENSSHTPPLF